MNQEKIRKILLLIVIRKMVQPITSPLYGIHLDKGKAIFRNMYM